ncbi:hypothetical protein CWB96_03435 [Pseudoalteromonas citrea]|uniref:Uncharacterized protein n=1 Tax=Pseudoalteromonas citrea TaxID=43655 RepID=A0A5S3XTE0_9GAMM|nr:hypothetical protein [Pseudoalteromonas citrea]TMP43169.1 hypothetical protein CWB97_09820 [Pseudoalteromonas citrea]TMP61710.1 hypothetical protein CWB96_03435 [Pseudoalteromonas citrea]
MIVSNSMNLTATNPYTASAGAAANTTTGTTHQPNTDTVTISNAAKQAESNWQNIATKYNVHSITAPQMRTLSRDLFDSGFIGAGEMMAIGAPTSMLEDPTIQHDLLNDMRHTFKLSSALSGHTEQAKTTYLNAIDVLEHLAQSGDQLPDEYK